MLASILIAVLAWLSPAATLPVPPAQPVAPPVLKQNDYVSELPKAGMTAEMFSRPVKPQANLISLFSTNDYPLESVRNAEHGTVAVVIRVDAAGRISDCIVEQSSGFPALDSQTCRILWLRARFVPARDAKGRAVDSAWRQRIRWELPEPDPMPVEPWSIRLTLDFVEGGGILSCKVETTGAIDSHKEDCDFLLTLSDGLAKLRADADYQQGRMVMETQFSPDATVPTPKPPQGMQLSARQVARIIIDEAGKPLKCHVVETEGPEPPIAGCDDLLRGVYQRPKIENGAIEATLVRSLYLAE